jgi:biopolymer transport protein ExbD
MAVQFVARKSHSARIDITPIVDMVFLLLIFFMLGAQFANPVFELNLPEADSANRAPPAGVTIALDNAGRLYLNRHQVNAAELVEGLRAALDEDGATPVLLRADASARFDAVVQALDAAEKAGVRNLSIEHGRPHE